jgi:hypothetical protein
MTKCKLKNGKIVGIQQLHQTPHSTTSIVVALAHGYKSQTNLPVNFSVYGGLY